MNQFEQLSFYKNRSLSNIETIENVTRKNFDVSYPDLAKEHSDAMSVDTLSERLTAFRKFKIKTDKLVDELNEITIPEPDYIPMSYLKSLIESLEEKIVAARSRLERYKRPIDIDIKDENHYKNILSDIKKFSIEISLLKDIISAPYKFGE